MLFLTSKCEQTLIICKPYHFHVIIQLLKISFHTFRVTSERFFVLANLIVEIFPSEEVSTYYTPYSNDKVLQIKSTAKGKLQNRYNHFRGLLIESNVARSARGQKKSKKKVANVVRLGFHGGFSIESKIIFSLKHLSQFLVTLRIPFFYVPIQTIQMRI